MKTIFYIIVLSLVVELSSCQNQSTETSNKNSSGSATKINTSISVDDFEKKLSENENPQLLDVRTPEEFSEGHLKGALNYNMGSSDFENKITSLDKKRPVLVYCLSGGRSSSAAELLSEKGFSEVYNLAGGIMKWNAKNKPVEIGIATSSIQGLSVEDFNKLINTNAFVLVDYNAKWCKPCQKMAPMLDAFVKSRKDKLTLVKIDADENKTLLKEKGIEGIPVLELYKNGKRIWKHEGEILENVLAEETGL